MQKNLDEKTKELIALGCSVAAKCRPCLKYHLKKAKEAGVKKWEIQESINLSKIISAKSTEFMAKFTNEAWDENSDKESACCSPETPGDCKI